MICRFYIDLILDCNWIKNCLANKIKSILYCKDIYVRVGMQEHFLISQV